MGKSGKAKNNAKKRMPKKEKKVVTKKRAKGHRQKGAGTIATSRGIVVHGGVAMQEWQRTPKQLVYEMCASLKRPRPQWRNIKGTVEGRFRLRIVLPDPKHKRENDLIFTPTETYSSRTLAENMVALLALARFDRARPHERRMPEPFKSAWIKLIASSASSAEPATSRKKETRAERKEREARERKAESERRRQIAAIAHSKGPSTTIDRSDCAESVDSLGASLHGNATLKSSAPPQVQRAKKRVVEVDDMGRPKRACFQFLEHGECRFGSECRYSHIRNDGSETIAPRYASNSDISVTATGYFASKAERDRARIETQHRRAHRRLERERKRKRVMPSIAMSEQRRRRIEEIVRSVRAAWNAELDSKSGENADGVERSDEEDAKATSRLVALGFSRRRCDEAVRAIRRRNRSAAKIDRKSDADADLSELLDWLMINCDESELPKQFNPTSHTIRVIAVDKSSTSESASSKTSSVDPSVNALARFGHAPDACARVLQRSDVMGDACRAAYVLFEETYTLPKTSSATAESDGDSEDEDDEVVALEAIYGDDFVVVEDADSIDARGESSNDRLDRLHAWLRVTFHDLSGVEGAKVHLVFFRGTGAASDRARKDSWALLRIPSLSFEKVRAVNREFCDAAVRRAESGNGTMFDMCSWVQDGGVSEALSKWALGSKPRKIKSGRDETSSQRIADVSETEVGVADETRKDASFFQSHVAPPRAAAFGSLIRRVASGSSRRDQGRSHGRGRQRRQVSEKAIAALSSTLLIESQNVASKSGDAFAKMQTLRSSLPMHRYRKKVVEIIEGSSCSLISGETGCGKTTQVPQFILEHYIQSNRGGRCSIVCTQPRRLAAIGVAERVADERFEKCGDVVGYSIRGDSKSSARTRLMFCTTGILLRRMQCSGIDDITHVLVDEVHERGVDTDFLLCLLKDLLQRRPSLKVVLMSATLDADRFVSYFGGPAKCPSVKVPGRTFPVKQLYIEDVWKLTGNVSKRMRKSCRKRNPDASDDAAFEVHKKRYGADIAYALENYAPKADLAAGIDYASIVELVRCICDGGALGSASFPDGAILVFMPGTSEISRLVSMLRSSLGGATLALPLHGGLSGSEQRRVFRRPPAGVRKIVVSTNIAETSITIDDVVYVIDSGRVKEMQYDAYNKMPRLVETFVSRASADQRKGRAGRVRNGFCYRMYPLRAFRDHFSAYQRPEICRVPLESLCLQIKVLQIGKVQEFLGRAIDPPDRRAVKAAMDLLFEIRALERKGTAKRSNGTGGPSSLTPLGRHLASLPVDVRVGKALIFGSILRCVEPVITIAALMSGRSPFLSPPDKRREARDAQSRFKSRRSDHLTLLMAYRQWESSSNRRRFASDHFLRHESLEAAASLRKQFSRDVAHLRMLPVGCSSRDALSLSSTANENAAKLPLIRAALCAGLYANVVKAVSPSQRYEEVQGGAVAVDPSAKEIRYFCRSTDQDDKGSDLPRERVFIHPASVNFDERSFPMQYLIFHSKVKTSRVFLRDSTAVPPYALLLFGGDLRTHHESLLSSSRRREIGESSCGEISVDGWIKFEAPSRVGALVRELRTLLEELLRRKIESPGLEISRSPLIKAIVMLLMNTGDEGN